MVMKGHVVIDTGGTKTGAEAEFVGKVPAAVAAHGGRFLPRTGGVESFRGEGAPKRFVIMESGSLEPASGLIGISEYGAPDDVRLRASQSRIVIAEGCDS